MNELVRFLLCVPMGACLYVSTREINYRYGPGRAFAWAAFFLVALLVYPSGR